MVPSVLLPPEDPSGHRARTARDWLVDLAFVVGAVALGIGTVLAGNANAQVPMTASLWAAELAAGGVAVLTLFLRRARPVGVAAATAALGAVSVTASVAAAMALFTVAVHRRVALVAPVLVANVVIANLYSLWRPNTQPWWVINLASVAVSTLVMGYGMFVRARRQLVWTLQERAQRAEAEQELLAEHARAAERARLAREMHDVLGHRISLLALQAGSLEVRPDLPAPRVAEVAGLLRGTARQALEELRTVIGILREDGTVDAPSVPQPTLADLGRLVDDSRRAGASVALTIRVDESETAPEAAGRVAYRVVQEALTNVAKHAPGEAAVVDVSGGPDDGLVIRVRSGLAITPSGAAGLPGGGVGLIGLRERVDLAGGRLEHGPDGRGGFVVEARLQWS